MAGGRRILDFRLSEGRSSGPTGWGGSYGGGEAVVGGDLKLVGAEAEDWAGGRELLEEEEGGRELSVIERGENI